MVVSSIDDSIEILLLTKFVQAYDDEDKDTAKRALASPFIRHMDVEYARLARVIPLPEGIQATAKATVVTNAQQAYTSPPPEEVMKKNEKKYV